MFNFIHFFLILIYFSLNLVCSQQSDVGVSDDFKDMLRSPHTPSSTKETFATHVTRPFVQNPKQDKRFFSDPKTSRPNWDQQHKDWSKTQNSTSPLNIFEAMGISRRGLLNNDPAKYRNISNAQTQGMLGILKGDLGFQDRSCTKDEGVIIARELLNIGRSVRAGALLNAEIKELEKAYSKETNLARKQHMQISALLMLQGADSRIIEGQWYLDGLQKVSILENIKRLVNPETINQEDYKQLIKEAKEAEPGKWEQVSILIQKLPIASANAQQRSVLEAISRLNDHYRENRGELTESLWIDMNTLNKESRRLSPRVSSTISPQQRLDQYLSESPILKLYVGIEKEKLSDSLRKGLSTWVQKNGNKWPGNEKLKIAEQFFWNFVRYVDNSFSLNDLVNLLFNVEFLEHPRDWKNFKDFTDPYLVGVDAGDKPYCMQKLLTLYRAFANEEERNKFIAFCDTYLVGVGANIKPSCMQELLPIYQAFATEEKRNKFTAFCDTYLAGVGADYKPSDMKFILRFYRAFSTEEERNKFIAFCDTYLIGVYAKIKSVCMIDLLLIYQAFSTEEERNKFTAFCDTYLVGVGANSKPHCMASLLPIYQAFATEEGRNKFTAFCDPYLVGVGADYKPSYMKSLLPIYQAFATEEERNQFIDFCDRYLVGVGATKVSSMKSLLPIYLSNNKEDFELFIRLHSRYPRVESLISSYLPRSYLRYMRVNGALEAERITDPSRVQSMYETGSNDPLPVLWPDDPFLPQARGMRGNGTANAHDFEAVYELESHSVE